MKGTFWTLDLSPVGSAAMRSAITCPASTRSQLISGRLMGSAIPRGFGIPGAAAGGVAGAGPGAGATGGAAGAGGGTPGDPFGGGYPGGAAGPLGWNCPGG